MNYSLPFSVGIFFFELICRNSFVYLRTLPFVIVVLFPFGYLPFNLLYDPQIISPLVYMRAMFTNIKMLVVK